MAVAEMSKLNLVAMSYDRDVILNSLQRTGAVEVKLHSEIENTVALCADGGQLRSYLTEVEGALERLSAAAEAYNKDNKIKSDDLKDGFEISYSQFIGAGQNRDEMDGLVRKINLLCDKEKELGAELNRVRRTLSTAEIYSTLKSPLKTQNTAHTKIKLGTIPANQKQAFFNDTEEGLIARSVLAEDSENVLIFVAAHNSEEGRVEGCLQNAGFAACPFNDGCTGEELYSSLKMRELEILKQLKENNFEIASLGVRVRELKIYCDYLAFELEKLELSDKMRATQTTFLLEAYVPKDAEEAVKQALSEAASAVYFEFSKPSEDEIPPTLLKNNKVVKSFEAVTDMYSPVSYKEFDPNVIMAFFYSVFLGFIMGDIGYGLLMIVFGGFVYFKIKRQSTMKSLAGVFAVGGIFALVWGFLFNSFFGINMTFMPTVIPDAQKDMWLLMGIKIPAVLIISLLIGIVQLCAGYVCRAVQCWRRGKLWDGILDGMVWALFTVGVGLALIGLIEQFNAPSLAYAGGILAGAMLVTAMLTAGRKEKLLGKFTKGFGAAYGVINFASDVLSYARLYGLMLSGAVIAQIISGYAVIGMNGGEGLLFSGNAGLVIIGLLLMIVGHAFNLAIGLLGAYIHDARLQYVEFYGRFYEGEGELFAPLGSKHKYIYLNN